jgi:hypothetical protein
MHDSTMQTRNNSGCLAVLTWPFVMLFELVAAIVKLVGRLGAVLTVTVIGAVVGVPLILLGLLLVVRSLF